MIEIKRYTPTHKNEWNTLIKESKNGLFFFLRDFMDYHADRFTDHSLLIYNKSSLIAVLPANEKENTIFSHQGLTFGSLILTKKIKTIEVLEVFNKIIEYYKELKFSKIIYKTIPYIFHSYPSQEDIYALYRYNAKLIKRELSTVIDIQKNKIEYSSSIKNLVNKLTKNGFEITEEKNAANFWELTSFILNRQHGVAPVHSLQEIQLLMDKLPENIRLFTLYENEKILAGVLIFAFGDVIHTQYMSNSDEGRKKGALAFVNYYLINNIFKDKKYYSFGISTEQNGYYLNEGLVHQKEQMGGRGIVLDTYEITLQ